CSKDSCQNRRTETAGGSNAAVARQVASKIGGFRPSQQCVRVMAVHSFDDHHQAQRGNDEGEYTDHSNDIFVVANDAAKKKVNTECRIELSKFECNCLTSAKKQNPCDSADDEKQYSQFIDTIHPATEYTPLSGPF